MQGNLIALSGSEAESMKHTMQAWLLWDIRNQKASKAIGRIKSQALRLCKLWAGPLLAS